MGYSLSNKNKERACNIYWLIVFGLTVLGLFFSFIAANKLRVAQTYARRLAGKGLPLPIPKKQALTMTGAVLTLSAFFYKVLATITIIDIVTCLLRLVALFLTNFDFSKALDGVGKTSVLRAKNPARIVMSLDLQAEWLQAYIHVYLSIAVYAWLARGVSPRYLNLTFRYFLYSCVLYMSIVVALWLAPGGAYWYVLGTLAVIFMIISLSTYVGSAFAVTQPSEATGNDIESVLKKKILTSDSGSRRLRSKLSTILFLSFFVWICSISASLLAIYDESNHFIFLLQAFLFLPAHSIPLLDSIILGNAHYTLANAVLEVFSCGSGRKSQGKASSDQESEHENEKAKGVPIKLSTTLKKFVPKLGTIAEMTEDLERESDSEWAVQSRDHSSCSGRLSFTLPSTNLHNTHTMALPNSIKEEPGRSTATSK